MSPERQDAFDERMKQEVYSPSLGRSMSPHGERPGLD